MCEKVVAVVLVVELSPKSQNRLVMVPLELSVKLTVSGLSPLVGLPLKLAAGATAPVPVSALAELPPLLVKTTTLLKLAALAGLKATCTWPVWPGARLKGLPPAMAKGSVALAVPVRVRPPPLTTWKLSVLAWPITTGPKLRLAGLIANNGGGLVTAM